MQKLQDYKKNIQCFKNIFYSTNIDSQSVVDYFVRYMYM